LGQKNDQEDCKEIRRMGRGGCSLTQTKHVEAKVIEEINHEQKGATIVGA